MGNGGVLTQCSPVNFTWSAAIKREGSTGTFEGDYIASRKSLLRRSAPSRLAPSRMLADFLSHSGNSDGRLKL